ncbi:MAG: 16S rRNA (adenine(1518)-N(6)/adenine(1519)-N(6))-dimethyltransferase RsmA [Candidatus Dormibacteria bacterium]
MRELDLCRESTVRAVARRFGLSPERGRGQSFLVDRQVRDAIVASLPDSPPLVLEVGPGLGSLTQGLLEAGRTVVGVEVDHRAAAALGLLRVRHPELRVVEESALRVGPEELGIKAPYIVVGNLPYSITGALLSHLLDMDPAPLTCHVLLQREVALRLAAPVGRWSLATLAVQLAATCEVRLQVGPESFWPRPKVSSALVELVPRRALERRAREALLQLARPVFQQRRKQLRHGVALATGVSPQRAARLLEMAQIDPAQRPGAIDLGQWVRLATVLGAGDGEPR